MNLNNEEMIKLNTLKAINTPLFRWHPQTEPMNCWHACIKTLKNCLNIPGEVEYQSSITYDGLVTEDGTKIAINLPVSPVEFKNLLLENNINCSTKTTILTPYEINEFLSINKPILVLLKNQHGSHGHLIFIIKAKWNENETDLSLTIFDPFFKKMESGHIFFLSIPYEELINHYQYCGFYQWTDTFYNFSVQDPTKIPKPNPG